MNRLALIIPTRENCRKAYSDSVQTGGMTSGVVLPERTIGIIPPVEIARAAIGKGFLQLLEPESE